jgi:histidinol-phosphate phosphatase family protein
MKQVVILVGGLGSRLDAGEPGVPKALRRIDELTVLEWQIKAINNPKIEILLLIGEEKNRKSFLAHADILSHKYGNKFQLIAEKERSGTLGAIISAKEYLDHEFIVLLGDILLDYPINKLISVFERQSKDALVVVRETDHPEDSDVFQVDPSGKIMKFSHYPHNNPLSEGVHLGLTGLYVFKKRFIQNIPKNRFIDIWELFDRDYAKNSKIDLHFTFNRFKDIGTNKRFDEGTQFSKNLNFDAENIWYVIDRDDTLIADPLKLDSNELNLNKRLVNELIQIAKSQKNVIFCISTNQPAIAKGWKTESEIQQENDRLVDLLKELGLEISIVEYCPHHPEKGHEGEIKSLKMNCFCRKPLPGATIKMIKKLGDYPKKIIVYGDSHFDYFLAKKLSAEFRWRHFNHSNNLTRNKALYVMSKEIAIGESFRHALKFFMLNFFSFSGKRDGK